MEACPCKIGMPVCGLCLRWLVFGAALLFASLAHAEWPGLRWQAGAGITDFGFKEMASDGQLLVREDGLLPGIHARVSTDLGEYTLGLDVGAQKYTVDYRGRTQGGSPLSTRTREQIADVSLMVSRTVRLAGVTPKIGVRLGRRHWRRSIQPTATTLGLKEIYDWPYILFGGELRILKRNDMDMRIRLMAGKAFGASLDVDIEDFDPATIDLPDGNVLQLGLLFAFNSDQVSAFQIEPYLDYWHFDRSNEVPLRINGLASGLRISEPENETLVMGVRVSWRL